MIAVCYGLFGVLIIVAALTEKKTIRQLLLLGASYAFYVTWGAWFLAVLIGSSLMNFGIGRRLRRKPTVAMLALGIAGNVFLLAAFKVPHSLVLPDAGPVALAMPLGVSFWTFQALSYLFDLYREEDTGATLLEFCLYMAFWPTVASGPICRLPAMVYQFRQRPPVTSEGLIVGVHRIFIGLVMKLAVAETLATGFVSGQGVEAGFDRSNVVTYGGLDVFVLAVGFGFQLFFDFAGYSNIVIGAARIMGYRLDENFNSPFLALTPSEFWTRWHMSLSSWIRDYVFLPVASAGRGVIWRYFALLFSMTLFGLWHGVSATFVLWGVYHGVLLVAHRLLQQLRRSVDLRLPASAESGLSWAVSFAAISIGWILFRAQSLPHAVAMLDALFTPSSYTLLTLPGGTYALVLAVFVTYFGYSAGRIQLMTRFRTTHGGENRNLVDSLGLTRASLQ